MKKILILIGFLYSLNSFSQSTVLLRGDTVRVYKQGGNATLKVDSSIMLTKYRQGASTDSVMTWNATTKLFGMRDPSSFGSGGGFDSTSKIVWRILLEGQSNNMGVGFVADLTNFPISNDNYTFTLEQSRVYIFNPQTGVYEKLSVPNNNQAANNDYYTAGVGTTAAAFGPELGIAQRWMLNTSPADTLFIDKNTVDGGAIAAFQSGTDYYDTILARRVTANAWLAARGKTVLDIGYHWVQGEGDMGSSEGSYTTALNTLINDRVADNLIDTINGIVVLAQINVTSANYGAGVAASKVAYVAAHSFARLTTYTDNFNVDNIHLDAMGQLQLGYDGYQQIFQTNIKRVGTVAGYYNIILVDSSSAISPNLKAYYAMEETSGNILDGTANGFDLTRVNSTASVAGKVGLGSGFTGASQQSLLGSASNSLSAGIGFTAACWAYIGTSAAHVLISKSNSGTSNLEYFIYWNTSNEFRFAMSDDGTYQVGHDITSSTGGSFTPGSWHYVACVWDGSTMYLYVDNVLRASTALASAFNTGTANLVIGDAQPPPVLPYDGSIDEVMIWDIALSPTELTYWYNSGTGRTLGSGSPTYKFGVASTASNNTIQIPNLEVTGGAVFEDSVYFENVPYNSGAGIVHLGLDTVAASPTFGKLVRKTAGGSTPTLQQVLTAGSTLTGDNTIVNDANTLTITGNTISADPILSITSSSTAAASNLQKGLNIDLNGANSNSAQTTYGAYISNTHTGTTSVNQGLSALASGAVTNYALVGQSITAGGTTNIAGYFSAANATNNYGVLVNGGNSGFGTTTPTMKLQVNGSFVSQRGSTVAAANDLTLQAFNSQHISGNTQINAITSTGWVIGSMVLLIFDSNPLVKNNTSGGGGTAPILLAGGVDFSATANDVLVLFWDGANWYEVSRSVN